MLGWRCPHCNCVGSLYYQSGVFQTHQSWANWCFRWQCGSLWLFLYVLSIQGVPSHHEWVDGWMDGWISIIFNCIKWVRKLFEFCCQPLSCQSHRRAFHNTITAPTFVLHLIISCCSFSLSNGRFIIKIEKRMSIISLGASPKEMFNL